MQAGEIISNNAITDVHNDTQQGKKAIGPSGLTPAGGGEEKGPAQDSTDVTVTLSAEAVAAAATAQANIAAGNGNAQTAQLSQVNENVEAAQAIRAYNNASQAAANNNENMIQNQQPPQETKKTINRLGGTA